MSLFFKDGLNFTSLQLQPQTPDNRTIQNFVKSYVDEYVGEYTLTMLFVLTCEDVSPSLVIMSLFRLFLFVSFPFKMDSIFPRLSRNHNRLITVLSRAL